MRVSLRPEERPSFSPSIRRKGSVPRLQLPTSNLQPQVVTPPPRQIGIGARCASQLLDWQAVDVLLDEPMAGMNVEEKEDMSRFILDVNSEFGTTIALIEHDMGVVMDVSDRVVVLDYGRKIAEGPPEQVRKELYWPKGRAH